MRIPPETVIQDLLIGSVVETDDEVAVGVYGGRDNACGVVRFRFPDAAVRTETTGHLTRWWAADEPVTLLIRGVTATLLSEHAMLRRALTPG